MDCYGDIDAAGGGEILGVGFSLFLILFKDALPD